MSKLQVHERFKDARLERNIHGKQSMANVQRDTGVSASLISELENPDKREEDGKLPRNVSYKVVAKLAKHYGVSADWLMGLSDVVRPSIEIRAISEITGLSEKSILSLKTYKSRGFGDFAETMLSIMREQNVLSDFLFLEHTSIESPSQEPGSSRDALFDYWRFMEDCRQHGQVPVSPKDFIKFKCREIGDAISDGLYEIYWKSKAND